MVKFVLNSKVCPVCFHKFSEDSLQIRTLLSLRASPKTKEEPYFFKQRRGEFLFAKGRSVTYGQRCYLRKSKEAEINMCALLICKNCRYEREIKIETNI